MANYNVSECITNEQYVISASTLTPGDTIGFYIGELLFCGVVGDETTNPEIPLSLYGATYTSCCECLSAITDSLNFRFINCNTLEVVNIEATNFCNDYGTPLTGRTYEIQFGSETPFCATFQELSPSGETNYFYVSGPYTDCGKCETDVRTTTSAGTESKICIICCPCGSTGSTITSVSPPHPTWTNLSGDAVVILNAVTLGGPNGLNS